MSRLLFMTLASLALLGGCSQSDPLERTLAELKPRAAFPAVELLPQALQGHSWINGVVHKTSSDLPMTPGGPLCSAYTTVLITEGGAPPQNFLALFCGGKRVAFGPETPVFTAPTVGGDPKGRGRFEVTFAEAVAPGEVIVWHTERSLDEKEFLTVKERAWRVREGKLEQILEATGVDPTIARTKLENGRLQVQEAQVTYAAGFVGETFPKPLALRGSNGGRRYVLRYDYTEAGGYRAPTPLPGPTAPPPAQGDAGTPPADGGASR